ncbi:hypothetical protein H310_10423 [Aphanomyces invadans]|uniref:peptidylprolyl isomerase n=1 Tax=Aphanomyces invadans TaxID=157072 RepID=A0A024TQF8_9STRA|nr:hypothetical protein H310_10423 [Aphanomyces invadans]ETV96239.1 hypothetical protein H310_10423 [Aphanomyces invadans]|eukprot:XP_008875031.1 hypothetical protein H310_10423 [Aphanomyces invadans]
MVVVKGKDKRRGNEADNLEVISHTKGMRTLGGPSSGRFAADMRVRVGGYGRPDQTWGVDHPWHKTGEVDLHQMMSAKDRMEDGMLVEERPQGHGMSRAALKRKKKQQKLGKVPPVVAPTPSEPAADDAPNKKSLPVESKKLALFDDSDNDDVEPAPPTKKQKPSEDSSNVVKAKKQKAAAKPAHKTKRELQKQQREKEAAAKDLALLVEEKPVQLVLPLAEREALVAQYDAALGTDVKCPSGLVLRDTQLGRGQLPQPGQMLTVRYKGSLGQGGTVFGKGMLSVKFGEGAIISGWEEGLATMRPSGKRLLTIPPELAYGAAGKGDKIPPHSTLFFDVELVRIGTRQRDAVGDDDIPLPKAFVRQRIKDKASDAKLMTETDGKSKGKQIDSTKGPKLSHKKRGTHHP